MNFYERTFGKWSRVRRRLWTAVILDSQLSSAALFGGTTGSYRVTPFFHHEPKKRRMRTAAVKSLRRDGYAQGLISKRLLMPKASGGPRTAMARTLNPSHFIRRLFSMDQSGSAWFGWVGWGRQMTRFTQGETQHEAFIKQTAALRGNLLHPVNQQAILLVVISSEREVLLDLT